MPYLTNQGTCAGECLWGAGFVLRAPHSPPSGTDTKYPHASPIVYIRLTNRKFILQMDPCIGIRVDLQRSRGRRLANVRYTRRKLSFTSARLGGRSGDKH